MSVHNAGEATDRWPSRYQLLLEVFDAATAVVEDSAINEAFLLTGSKSLLRLDSALEAIKDA